MAAGLTTDLSKQTLGEGRYLVREKLGTGSMGHVFRAFDTRLEIDVVVKVPTDARLSDPEFHQRFLQESKVLAKLLSHPQVVKILDVGQHAGVPFFVMPFIGGGSLADKLTGPDGRMRRMKPKSLKHWLKNMAAALDFMHDQGFVHRDVKPANILFDEHGHAYLTDFGLSKLLLDAEESASGLTAPNAVVGTPNFVAPEIVLAQDYDGTADQYSLAMTVYAALAGRCPLEGKTASATLVNQTSKYPAPLQQVAPDVNDAMSKAVRKALSKKPEDRYSSCVEFADAVLSALDPSSQSSASSHSTVRQGAPFFRVVATSKVKKGVAPCPHCKKPLAIKPHYGGQRGSCVSCKVKLYVTQDRREVRQIQYVGGNQELHASGELIIGQVVFGWKLNKYAVMALLACCGIAVVSSAIYIGRKSAEPEKREPPSKVGFEARSKADSALGK